MTFLLVLALLQSEWTFLEQGKNQHGVVNVHFAPKTITRNDDLVKVWIRATNHWGSFFRVAWHGSVPMPEIGYVEMRLTLDCKKRLVRTDKSLVYNPNGDLTHTVTEKEKIKETPGSIGWMAFEYFCEKEGKKLTGPPTLK